MQQTSSLTAPTGKIYNTQAIIIATFVGGIFAAAYLVAANFKTFGLRAKAATTWLYAVLLFVAITASAFVPTFNKVPNVVYNVIITIMIAIYTSVTQKTLLDQHIVEGGAKHSVGRVVVVAVIGLAIMVSLALLAFMMADAYAEEL